MGLRRVIGIDPRSGLICCGDLRSRSLEPENPLGFLPPYWESGRVIFNRMIGVGTVDLDAISRSTMSIGFAGRSAGAWRQ